MELFWTRITQSFSDRISKTLTNPQQERNRALGKNNPQRMRKMLKERIATRPKEMASKKTIPCKSGRHFGKLFTVDFNKGI